MCIYKCVCVRRCLCGQVIVWGHAASGDVVGQGADPIRPCSSVLDVGDSATAVAFCPFPCPDNRYETTPSPPTQAAQHSYIYNTRLPDLWLNLTSHLTLYMRTVSLQRLLERSIESSLCTPRNEDTVLKVQDLDMNRNGHKGLVIQVQNFAADLKRLLLWRSVSTWTRFMPVIYSAVLKGLKM